MASASGVHPASTLGRHWGGSARRNDRRTLTLFSRVSSVELQVQSLARKMEMLLSSMQRMEMNMNATVERGRDRERDRRLGEGNEERRGSSLMDGTTVDSEGGAGDGTYREEENSEE